MKRAILAALLLTLAMVNPVSSSSVITITDKGTASSKISGRTLVIPAVNLNVGDSLIVGIVHDEAVVMTVYWGNSQVHQVVGAQEAGHVYGGIYALHGAAAGNANVTVTFSDAITAKAAFAVALSSPNTISTGESRAGIPPSVQGDTHGTLSSYPGDLDVASDGIVIAMLGTEGPLGDTAATWQQGFSGGQRDGTAGGGPKSNITIGAATIASPCGISASSDVFVGISSRTFVLLLASFITV